MALMPDFHQEARSARMATETFPSSAMAEAPPRLRRLTMADIAAALRAGRADFMGTPTQLLFLCVIYPAFGFVLARTAAGGALLPLVWPLISGFALVGPVAALGLYEISRRREAGLPTSWLDCFRVLQSPALPAILAMGVIMAAIFALWLLTARGIFLLTLGDVTHAGPAALLAEVFGTRGGWALLVLGNAAGLGFAVLVLAISTFSFPMLLDRQVTLVTAMATSWRAFQENSRVMLAWGLVVALGLAVGMATLFVGLALSLPILGHATWHLYRRALP
jgi:uncharacterized membrane protein